MSKFIVTAPSARLTSGVLVLTDKQAAVRSHNLKQVGKNRYEIVNPVEFKAGEEIGYEGNLPKSLADNLTGKAEAEAAAKKASQAEEKARSKAEAEAAKAEAEAAKVRAKLEDDALTAWESSQQLREQHANDFDAYLAAVLEQASI